MIAALIAAAVTLVAAIAVIVAVFVVRSRTKTPYAGQKKDVRSVGNVGVSSTLGGAGKRAGGGAAPRVNSSQPASKAASEGLKSRFLAMGVLTAAIFGSLGAKLWSMQVLASESYSSAAQKNKFTVVPTPAPRGYIYDADGVAIVKNRSSLTVLADAEVANDRDVVQRLSTVLGVPYNVVRQRIQDATSGAQSQRVVASDVRLRDVAFISEHADAFPGVAVQTRTVRDYPFGALAAHAVGYTGSVTADDLAAIPDGREIELGDTVGRAGVESVYDNLLAGDHGQRTVVADAEGNVVEVASETQPERGSDVYLCVKAPVQYVCDRALAELIAPEGRRHRHGQGLCGRRGGHGRARRRHRGAVELPHVLAGDVHGGHIAGYVGPVQHRRVVPSHAQSRRLGHVPRRVHLQGFYRPRGACLRVRRHEEDLGLRRLVDGFDTGQPQMCWKHSGHGVLDFRGGVVNSCDVVFYDIGKQFFQASKSQGGSISDTAMQDEIAKYGFGKKTGIDLGSIEEVGRIPTPEWRAEHFRDYPTEAVWKGGFNTNMAIGQGDVLVTPIQVAVAYGAIATGNLMKPHLLKEVRNSSGGVVRSFEPEVVGTPDAKPENLAVMRDALKGVSTDNAELVALFNKFGLDPATVACKTGTGEVAGKEDYAWFACYAPFDDPKYVVACVVEQGGGGSAVGAPLGIEVLAAALNADAGELTDVGAVAGSTGKSQELATSGSSGRTD